MVGYRITDAVEFFNRRGDPRRSVREVRRREPEKFRWRQAVSHVTRVAGALDGLDRMRVEEPIRELVLDLGSSTLRREVVLDARRYRVDLDRGEILPQHTIGDLRRLAFLIRTDVSRIGKYVRLPAGFDAPIDTAAVVLVSRAFAHFHRCRAEKLLVELPEPSAKLDLTAGERHVAEKARYDVDEAGRWSALSKALLSEETRPEQARVVSDTSKPLKKRKPIPSLLARAGASAFGGIPSA